MKPLKKRDGFRRIFMKSHMKLSLSPNLQLDTPLLCIYVGFFVGMNFICVAY